MKICVRAHDMGVFDSVEQVFEQAHARGFYGIQLVTNKVLSAKPLLLDRQMCDGILKASTGQNCPVVMLGAYFNPLHPDQNKVQAGIERFENHLRFAHAVDCNFVGSETGSLNGDKWTFHQQNHSQQCFDRVTEIFARLAICAKQNGANLAVEGAWAHCCGTPQMLCNLVKQIDNGNVFVTVDLFNYLNVDNYLQQRQFFDSCIDLLGDKTVIFHLKDFVLSEGQLKQVGLGRGLLDFDYVLPLIKKHCPSAYLVFEGVTADQMQDSLNYVSSKI